MGGRSHSREKYVILRPPSVLLLLPAVDLDREELGVGLDSGNHILKRNGGSAALAVDHDPLLKGFALFVIGQDEMAGHDLLLVLERDGYNAVIRLDIQDFGFLVYVDVIIEHEPQRRLRRSEEH